VLVAIADNDNVAKLAHDTLQRNGAESVDRARDMWWLGLRDVEKESYEASGASFDADEAEYRRGFERAVCSSRRGDTSGQSNSEGTASAESDAYRRGYERGCVYRDKSKHIENKS
jgi:hypothetical protein